MTKDATGWMKVYDPLLVHDILLEAKLETVVYLRYLRLSVSTLTLKDEHLKM